MLGADRKDAQLTTVALVKIKDESSRNVVGIGERWHLR